MSKVSVVMITHNEEHNLRQMLPLLYWCDEIVIVDSGSTDKTIDICQSHNCKIYHREFEGYGLQKKYAVSLAENDWVLSLDADEIPSDELIDQIRDEMINPSADGYYIPMVFVFMGKEFRYRYSTLAAEAAYTRGKKRSLLAVLLALPFNFFKCYFLDGNFLNGWSGFYWSVLSSFYQFIKYTKLREIYARAGNLQAYRLEG